MHLARQVCIAGLGVIMIAKEDDKFLQRCHFMEHLQKIHPPTNIACTEKAPYQKRVLSW